MLRAGKRNRFAVLGVGEHVSSPEGDTAEYSQPTMYNVPIILDTISTTTNIGLSGGGIELLTFSLRPSDYESTTIHVDWWLAANQTTDAAPGTTTITIDLGAATTPLTLSGAEVGGATASPVTYQGGWVIQTDGVVAGWVLRNNRSALHATTSIPNVINDGSALDLAEKFTFSLVLDSTDAGTLITDVVGRVTATFEDPNQSNTLEV